MSTRHSVSRSGDYPPLLRRLVQSAEAECPHGYAEALAAFIDLALRKVPACGVLDPGAQIAIEEIACAHFELDDARTGWRHALNAADLAVKPRNHIESAASRVQTTSDTAYFFAGLAFGLVYAAPHA